MGLTVDPLLSVSSNSLPQWPLPLVSSATENDELAGPSVIVTEGIPPVPAKVVEKIRRWEYIDLGSLLASHESQGSSGKDLQRNRKPPPVNNLSNWLVAFSRLMAVLLASGDTSHEEGAGLAAHLHTILQLHHDLGGSRWLKYDVEYREWAAAKGVKVWGDLNMSIYGRCLPQPPEVTDNLMPGPSYSSTQICYHFNKGRCTRPLCSYLHACELCRGPHTKLECPLKQRGQKRPKK